eukprot:6543490-Prymnesium_polylepis.1
MRQGGERHYRGGRSRAWRSSREGAMRAPLFGGAREQGSDGGDHLGLHDEGVVGGREVVEHPRGERLVGVAVDAGHGVAHDDAESGDGDPARVAVEGRGVAGAPAEHGIRVENHRRPAVWGDGDEEGGERRRPPVVNVVVLALEERLRRGAANLGPGGRQQEAQLAADRRRVGGREVAGVAGGGQHGEYFVAAVGGARDPDGVLGVHVAHEDELAEAL